MRKAIISAALACLACGITCTIAVVAFPQDGGEGSLLSNPAAGSAKLLEISPATLLPDYASIALAYEPRRMVYIVQDKDKVIRGKTTIIFSPVVEEGKAQTELVKAYDYPFRGRSSLMVDAENLAPKKYTLDFYSRQPPSGRPPNEPIETWTAEYYYDMVAVRVDAGESGTFASFRRPMKSFDFDELYLLFSQINVTDLPPKSVIFVTAPFEHRNHAVLLEDLGIEYIYAADAERHACQHLRLTFVDFTEEFYVERREPNRVIKFTQRDLTFTLQEDLTQREEDMGDVESLPEAVRHPDDFLHGGTK
jgi:hypothetical protein